IAQFIRINFLVPDARIGWNFRGYRKCLQIVNDEKPDIIFSSSPPHSLQILAWRLARKTKTRWVADFRDPWTKSFYDKGIRRWRLAENYNRQLEQKVVRSADCVTAVSEGVLQLIGAAESKKTRVISNGYDDDDFREAKQRNPQFTILYTGHIASVQNPELFFQAIAQIIQKQERKIKIEIYGSADKSVHQTVQQLGLSSVVDFHPYIAHNEVTSLMIHADMLLLLIPRENSKGILTGKLFEYLAAGNFIMGIGDEEGVAASVLKKCKAGTMIDYHKNPIEVIQVQYEKWTLDQVHQGDEAEIKKYSRENLSRELSNLFSEICS
ncbi:MAG: glycosyltransferase, partial [Saprospiraceae bacterium]|nr:glycosyltransferase [Saprospiraceae bacterium]